MEHLIRFAINIDAFIYQDGTKALADISLNVTQGEFAGVFGSNGSGKTTLLKIMDCLIKDHKSSVLRPPDVSQRDTGRRVYSSSRYGVCKVEAASCG